MTKIKWLSTFLLVFIPYSTFGQASHPRIWLDSATLTRLTTLKNANDTTWVNLKADADAYLTYSVPAYVNASCGSNAICYPYEGSGYLDPMVKLAMAYKMTGTASYCTQAKAIMNVLATAGLPPESVDSGYPSRNIVLGFAIVYDWCYDQLSASDITNYTSLLDTWWTWVQAHGYYWNASPGAGPNAYSNYFSGHLLGFGLAALAVEGDDINSASMQSTILANFNKLVVPAFTTGGFAGGFATEGYNYGGNTFIRIFQYMRGMTTAGKTDLFNTNISWLKHVATNMLYEERPDRWTIVDEGGWSGDWTRVFYYPLIYDLSGLLKGTTEGGWMKQLYSNFVRPPSAYSVPASLYMPSTFELFLYNQGQAAINYTASQPVYYFSLGDNHTIVRTDWTTSAVHTTFNGGTVWGYGDHASRGAGHISIQRGADYLLINAGMWQGVSGVTGRPSTADQSNWHMNTLFYWDQATDCLDQNTNGGQYAGCQMFWGVANTVKHKEGTGFTFEEAPLENAYINNHGLKTITGYTRSFVNIGGDVDFVFDRITAPATSQRKLEWHTPALNSATPPGNATSLTLAGAIASATVGASKVWIKTLLPTSPSITQVTDTDYWGSATLMGTQRFEVTDSNAATCSTNCLFLTVLSPTASSVRAMPLTTLISTANYKGALYDDGVSPRVAMFSTDGTSQTSVTYTVSYSSSLDGRHVILDLTPGTYKVTKDGAIIYSSLPVGSDGSLSFATAGGSSYTIQSIAVTLQPYAPTNLQATTF